MMANGGGSGRTMRITKVITGLALCVALAWCGLPATITAAFDAPLNPGTPIQTSPGNYSVTADDANPSVANAAAVQQVATTCAAMGLSGRVVNTSAASTDGRSYFTVNFQCQ